MWQIEHIGSTADKLIYRDNLLRLIPKMSKQFNTITGPDTIDATLLERNTC